jgi:hypothetical protein
MAQVSYAFPLILIFGGFAVLLHSKYYNAQTRPTNSTPMSLASRDTTKSAATEIEMRTRGDATNADGDETDGPLVLTSETSAEPQPKVSLAHVKMPILFSVVMVISFPVILFLLIFLRSQSMPLPS